MNLAELVDAVSYKARRERDLTRQLIKATLDTILEEVKKGGRVSIVGFGSFYRATRKSRVGRNPRTGEEVKISSSQVPRFRAGKKFRDALKKKTKRKS